MTPATPSSARLSARRFAAELAGIFLLSVLVATVRVIVPEPPNSYRQSNSPTRANLREDVNEFYDRRSDESGFYIPAIRAIHARWPRVDLSAIAGTDKPPGYPFIMATAAKLVGLETGRLRVVQILLSALISALLYGWVRRHWTASASWAILGPLVCSSFFVKASSYLTTDNPALLCALGALVALLRGDAAGWAAGAVLVLNTLAVTIRQDALWLVGPTLLVAARAARAGPGWQVSDLLRRCVPIAAVLVPCGTIAGLWLTWRGLVPPGFYQKEVTAGFGLTPLVYILSVVAICWWPYSIAILGWRDAVARVTRSSAMVCGLAGLLLVLLADTSYSQRTGHWGGYLWTLATLLPAFGRWSLPFFILAPAGALALAVVFRSLWAQNRATTAILGVAMLGWALSCASNPYVFHRYYETYVLGFIIVAAGLHAAGSPQRVALRNRAILPAFAAGQMAITVVTLYLSLLPTLRR